MAVQNISFPTRRLRPQQTAQVLRAMAYGEIAEFVARIKGSHLRALLDAAQDVAESSEWTELRLTAHAILAAARQSHPEYFDPTLRGR